MDDLLLRIREEIRSCEIKKQWLEKHNFKHEAAAVQLKIGGMFFVYDAVRDWTESNGVK